MSGSYYVLNAKYNSLLALIAGGGGGGGVSNPMTSDLNAGGFDITNATDINAVDLNASADLTANRVIATNLVQGGTIDATDILLTPNINRTDAPSYGNLGNIAPGNQYEIATIEPKVDAEGTILGVLRGLDTGLKHTVFFQVIGYADRAVIQILNNVSESDTPIFQSLEYGEDATIPTKNSLTFTCGTPSATCEIAFYQNGGDKGTGLGYGSPFIPATSGIVATHSSTYAQTTLNLNTAGTSANFKIDANLFADDTDTKNLQTNTLAVYTDPELAVNSTMNLQSANSIKQVVSVQTNEIVSGGAFPVQISSDADFGNNLLVNNAGDFLNINENIDLQAGHGIVNLTTLTGTNGGADDILMNSDIDMNNKAIINCDNIKVDSIFENTAGGDVSIHNTLNMTNNHIHNLAAPTQNGDGANKLYVDTVAGSSGVQNPMVANLDGGNFNITNLSGITAAQVQNTDGGVMSSRGTFLHGGSLATIGTFSVGGDEIIFAPNTSFSLRAFSGTPDYFVFNEPTATWEAKNGSTTAYATGSVATFSPGGLLQLLKTTSTAATGQELSILDVKPGTNQQEYLQTQGFSNAAPNIPKAITPTFTYNLSLQDVATQIPFNAGLAWDNTSDGSIIRMYDSNSLGVRFGLAPIGVNNHADNRINTYGYLCGVGINNASANGGWICSGGANIELIYTNVANTDSAFPTPIIIGSAGNAFNSESITIPQSNWVYCDRLARSGIELALRLNIPPGDTIDTQDPTNSSLNCNKFQTATIDLV